MHSRIIMWTGGPKRGSYRGSEYITHVPRSHNAHMSLIYGRHLR